MSFKIVKAETRTAKMIEWFSGICQLITDFTPGSKIRSKFESVAIEMEAQDFAFFQAVKKAIPIAIYQAFDFNLIAAVKSSGYVTISASTPATNPIIIPSGTQVSVPAGSAASEIIYRTQSSATIGIGQSNVSVKVVCDKAGTIGNTSANSITTIKSAVSGISSVTNPQALTNGAERETEPARKTRFSNYVQTLVRGTGPAIEHGASTAAITDTDGNITEQVAIAKVYEPYKDNPALPIGHIYCYIYNGVGGTSGDLLTKAQAIIDGYYDNGEVIPGYKAAGVICDVVAATEVPTDVACNVVAAEGKTASEKIAIQAACEAAIQTLIQTMKLGGELLNTDIVTAIKLIDGVYDVVVTEPAANVSVAHDRIITAGTITVAVA